MKMENCLEIDIAMDDISWNEEVEFYDNESKVPTKNNSSSISKEHQNDEQENSRDSINEDNLLDESTTVDDDQCDNINPPNHNHQLQLNSTETLKLNYKKFQQLKSENKFIVFVDIQFVGAEVVEIAICRPDLPIVFHDAYPTCQIFKINRPFAVLTQMHNNVHTNDKTIDNNMRYVNMKCCDGKNHFHKLPMKNNNSFFTSLPNDAIYVLRGINKHKYWRNLLQFYNKNGSIYLFWEKFYNPIHDRYQNSRGQLTCIHHSIPYSACSLANVRQMAQYYNHCEYMFF